MRAASAPDVRPANNPASSAVILIAVSTCPALLFPFGANPFDGHKAQFLWAMTAAAVAALAATPRVLGQSWGNFTGWHRALVVVLGAQLVAMLFSTALSEAPSLGWWGSAARRYGTLTEAAVLLILLCGLIVGSGGFRGRLITATIVGSVGPTVYLLYQNAGMEPLTWATVAPRAGSTFGNQLFLAGYLAVVWPLTIGAAIAAIREHRGVPWRAPALWVVVLLQAAGFLFTGSRGPLVALAGALTLAALLAAAVLGHRRTSAGLAAAIVAAGVAFLAFAPGRMQIEVNRVVTASNSSRSANTAAVRVMLWTAAGQGLLAQPAHLAFGTGPESTTAMLTTYTGPQLRNFEGTDTAPDRAHNATLETLVSFGVAGLLLSMVQAGMLVGITLTVTGLLLPSESRRFWILGSAVLAICAAVAYWGTGLWAVALVPAAGIAILVSGWILLRKATSPLADPMAVAGLIPFVAWLTHLFEIQLSVPTVGSSLAAVAAIALIAAPDSSGPNTGSRRAAGDDADPGATMAILVGWSAAVLSIALAGTQPGSGPILGWVIAATAWILSLAVSGVRYRRIPLSAATWLGGAGLWWLWPDPGPGTSAIVTAFALVDRLALFYVATAACVAFVTWHLSSSAGRARQWLTTLGAALIGGGLLLAFSLRLFQADVLARSAAALAGDGDATSAVALLESAVDRDPVNGPLLTQLGDALLAQAVAATDGGNMMASFKRAEDTLARARRADPFDYHHVRNLAALHRRRARTSPAAERDRQLAAADELYQSAVAMAPGSGALWAEWGNLEAERGRADAALAKLDRAAALGAVSDAMAVANALLRLQGVDVSESGSRQSIGEDFEKRGYPALAAAYKAPTAR